MSIRDSQDTLAWAIFGYLDLPNHGYFRLFPSRQFDLNKTYIYLRLKYGLICLKPGPDYEW